MQPEESLAAKMRQLLEAQHIVPTVAGIGLGQLVISTRPWSDERRVAADLRTWAETFWGEGSLDPGLADGAGEVAAHMRALGGLPEPPDDGPMIFVVLGMLRNVAARRSPAEYDLLRDHVVGVPARTLRRYRQRVRDAGGNPGLEALHAFIVALQYDLDFTALVRGGRTPAAARRWLQRNPGKHAVDAPPPRRHRSV